MASRKKKRNEGYQEIIPEISEKPKKKKLSRKKRRLRRIRRAIVTVVVLAVLYLTAVFSNIPFIAKWRTIYILTAMTTNSHQWLATMFIPRSVIDQAIQAQEDALNHSADFNTTWGDDSEITEPGLLLQAEAITDDTGAQEFYEKYWEIDSDTVHEYLEENPDLLTDGYASSSDRGF